MFDNQKMENSKIVCNQAYEEIDESIVKIETMEPEQNFDPGNVGVNLLGGVLSAEENNSNTTAKPKRRSRRKKLQSSATSTLRKERFRPIQPKPLQSGSSILRHKFGLSPMMNMSALASNRIIVPNTVSMKEKIRYVTPSDISNKTNNCIKLDNSKNINNLNNSNTINNTNNSDTVSILPVTEKNKIVKAGDSNTIANNNCNNNNDNNINNSSSSKDLHTIKTISKSHKNSIELFFESMAQTVLNLPNEVQADIKMQICKIVTMAEIRYCELQAKSKTEK